jgi:hypothetical protein
MFFIHFFHVSDNLQCNIDNALILDDNIGMF